MLYYIVLILLVCITVIVYVIDSFTTKTSLSRVIAKIKYTRGWTRTWKSLYVARYIFNESFGARPLSSGTPKIAILLTDGRSNGNSPRLNANDQARRLRDIGVQIYTVGIGRYNNIIST